MSKILSYIDNVVSNYDSSGAGTAEFPNLEITQTASISDSNIETSSIKNLTVGADPSTGATGYSFPVASPSNGDYLAYNGSSLEFRSFQTQSLYLKDMVDFVFNSTTNGSIPHIINNNTITVDPVTEATIIDGKSTALISQLKLTDRMLLAVDLPGSGTNLLKLTLRDLFSFIEESTTSVSSINSLTSNTGVNADETEIFMTIDDGVLEQQSKLDSTGLTIAGDLFFTANASMTLINDGFLFGRFANTIDLQFNGTQNIIVKDTEVQLGTGLYINNATLTVDVDSTIDQDLSTTSNTAFNTLNVNDTVGATQVGEGALIVAGGASVGENLHVTGNITSGGQAVATSSLQLKTNINEFENGLSYIMNMNPVTYNRVNSADTELGFIAEEMENVLPSVVKNIADIKGISYTQIIPVLVSALKEQQLKINEIESRINS